MFFKKDKIINELKAELKETEQALSNYREIERKDIQEIKHYKKKIKEYDLVFTEIEKERDELKTMVREQTEADLLVNALKAVGVIKEEKKVDYFDQRNQLNALSQQAAAMNTGRPSSFAGAAGLGNLFGGLNH